MMDKVLEEDYAVPELGEACLERWLWAPTVCKVQGALKALYKATKPKNLPRNRRITSMHTSASTARSQEQL